jgi:ribose 5-phosphate isomerase RpiB
MSYYTMQLNRILNEREEEIEEETYRRMEENESDDYHYYHREVVSEIEDDLVDYMID